MDEFFAFVVERQVIDVSVDGSCVGCLSCVEEKVCSPCTGRAGGADKGGRTDVGV